MSFHSDDSSSDSPYQYHQSNFEITISVWFATTPNRPAAFLGHASGEFRLLQSVVFDQNENIER